MAVLANPYFNMRSILALISLFLAMQLPAQQDSLHAFFIADNQAHRVELNEHYGNKEESPLDKKDLKKFKALPFFEINANYRVEAVWIRTPEEVPFEMPTSTERKPLYVKYGEIHFTIEGIACVLNVYQNLNLVSKEGYEDYLFLPFKDFTNGEETYGGGRYLDIRIPAADLLVVDFNKAYNPYCAYSHRFSCPLVPDENQLQLPILAGVKEGIVKK
jgi:uncharacterized protein